jgi:2-hydroxymuconate-semialdehyde hydrolase
VPSLGRPLPLDLAGISIHCREAGAGYPVICIHGSAPGASSGNTWARVFPQLANSFHFVASDLIGWGYSGRKYAEPYFDPDLWARQIGLVIDHVAPKGPVGLLGHSLGGYVALLTAARDSRVERVLANGSMGVSFPLNDVIEASWEYPASLEAAKHLYERILTVAPLEVRQQLITERLDLMAAPGYREYYSRLFAGPKQRYIDAAVLTKQELAQLTAKVLLVFGKEDNAVPYATAGIRLAGSIPQADLLCIAGSGHATMIEVPDKLCTIARWFFGA